jgi:hypothetical protein
MGAGQTPVQAYWEELLQYIKARFTSCRAVTLVRAAGSDSCKGCNQKCCC